MFSEVKGKFQQFSQLNAEIETAVENGLECVASQLAKQVALVGDQFAEHKQKLGEVAGTNKKLRDLFDGISERDLQPEQLQTIAMLQKQIECLEDQVRGWVCPSPLKCPAQTLNSYTVEPLIKDTLNQPVYVLPLKEDNLSIMIHPSVLGSTVPCG